MGLWLSTDSALRHYPMQPSLGHVLAVLLHEREVAVLRELLRPAMTLLDLDLDLLLLLLQAALSLRLGGLHNLRGRGRGWGRGWGREPGP